MGELCASSNSEYRVAVTKSPINVTSYASKLDASSVLLPTSALRPWPGNPRLNDGEPVRRVAASIARFGWGAPIIARAANLEIIAGHTRWKAAQQLELDEVPVRLLDVSEDEAHMLARADNRLGELAEWSDELVHQLQELQHEDLVISGWQQADLDRMTAELMSPEPLPGDELPPRLDRPGGPKEVTCPECGYKWQPSK